MNRYQVIEDYIVAWKEQLESLPDSDWLVERMDEWDCGTVDCEIEFAALPEITSWQAAFVCLHEIGHYELDHYQDYLLSGYSRGRELLHEIEANAWAIRKWEDLMGSTDDRIVDLALKQLCERSNS